MTTNKNASVLVVSCDKYGDLWAPFFNQFFKFWENGDYKIYLGANNKSFNDPRVISITTGYDISWSSSLMAMLKNINSRYVITLLDDFFLRSPVDFELLDKCMNAIVALDAHTIRLVPRPKPDRKIPGYPYIGLIDHQAAFRVSTQGAIWNRDSLMSLLRANENIWEFEINGSDRSRKEKFGYYSVWKPALTYKHHVIERGKWFRREARLFGSMNIGCDFAARPVMTEKESYYWHLRKIISYPQTWIPWMLRQSLKKCLAKIAK